MNRHSRESGNPGRSRFDSAQRGFLKLISHPRDRACGAPHSSAPLRAWIPAFSGMTSIGSPDLSGRTNDFTSHLNCRPESDTILPMFILEFGISTEGNIMATPRSFKQELVCVFGQPVAENPTQAMMEVVYRTGRRATEWEIALVQVAAARIAGISEDRLADSGAVA